MPISTTQHDARNSVQSTSTINWQFAGNYTNDGMAAVSGLTVDHLVPLSEAWQSGAYRWSKATRRQHANDLGYPSTLVAVTRQAAAAKGSAEPQRWMPRAGFRCSYAAQWVAVKWRWRLAVDPAERRFLVRTLTACDWPSVRAPGRATIR